MRELCEFRFDERDAQRFLEPGDGELIGLPGGGGVRKLVLEASDSRFSRIGELERQFKKKGAAFFTSWNIRRQYELRLDPSRLPRAKDLARTIAYSEVVFSSRLVEAFKKHDITGARFHPVLRKGGKGGIDAWYQLAVCSRPLEVVPPTRFGIDPFDLDEKGEYRCPLGHVAGLNLLSELFVRRGDYDGSDVCATRQLVGPRSRNGGVFRPYSLLLISPKLRDLLGSLKSKGFELERAHLA